MQVADILLKIQNKQHEFNQQMALFHFFELIKHSQEARESGLNRLPRDLIRIIGQYFMQQLNAQLTLLKLSLLLKYIFDEPLTIYIGKTTDIRPILTRVENLFPAIESNTVGYGTYQQILRKTSNALRGQNNDLLTSLIHSSDPNIGYMIEGLLIVPGTDIHHQNHVKFTPLHEAAYANKKTVAALLIAFHAVIDAQDNELQTPLHRAAASGHTDIVELLIQHDTNTEAKDVMERTALHLAALEGFQETVTLLLNSKANIDATDEDGMTPLNKAIARSHPKIIELLVNNKAKTGIKNRYDQTPGEQFRRHLKYKELSDQLTASTKAALLMSQPTTVHNETRISTKLDNT